MSLTRIDNLKQRGRRYFLSLIPYRKPINNGIDFSVLDEKEAGIISKRMKMTDDEWIQRFPCFNVKYKTWQEITGEREVIKKSKRKI